MTGSEPTAAAAAPTWCVLFVAAASPGAVLRFLERRAAPAPFDLLLSAAPAGSEPMRVLAPGPAASDQAETWSWMSAAGPILAPAFPPRVTLLWADEARGVFGWRVWEGRSDGEPGEIEHGEAPVAPPSTLQRLAGLAAGATKRALAWAEARGLPADRVPVRAGRRERDLPVVFYQTVAGLDARGLLREDGAPRWYQWRAAQQSPGHE